MKTKTKALVLTLCAVILVAATVLGTMAYLTDTKTVVNTFTVGDVEITLDEADVNTDGTVIDGADRVTENAYHLIPGKSYTKDPTITVAADSEDSFLFVKVINPLATLGIEDATTIADQMAANNWVALDGVENTYYYNGVVTAEGVYKVFETFSIKSTASGDDLAALSTADPNTVTITAYAVQAETFENNTYKEIWDAAFGE